jgi:acyl-CoA reductase-like NAD-dependent aldehyde dehydrogenase
MWTTWELLGINVGVIATKDEPFGGVKQSGLGNKPIYLRINSMYRNWSTT